MNKNKFPNQSGAALLLYLLIMTFFIALLMTTTYSRLLLSLKRAEASTDSIAANYRAESEVYDIIARLSGGFLTQNPLDINEVKQDGNTKLTIKGTQSGNTQTISVTVDRPFASSKIVADRLIETVGSTENLDIIMSLDCTGSMNSPADSSNPGGPTRIDALEQAALGFVNNIAQRADKDKFRIGVDVFGIDAKWINYNGKDIKPENSVSLDAVSEAISASFNSTRDNSPACLTVMNSTSVGTPFVFSHEYFKAHKKTGTKQVEIVITDGLPNTRIPYAACAPSSFCPSTNLEYCTSNPYGWTCPTQPAGVTCTMLARDFLRCAIADNKTSLPGETPFGLRDPDVSAYGVTILGKPQADEVSAFNLVVSMFNTYLGPDNYFNATNASQLPSILTNIYNDIITKHETITVRKVLPGE